jgi:hypothetical protein
MNEGEIRVFADNSLVWERSDNAYRSNSVLAR